jgi:hypothetical protein
MSVTTWSNDTLEDAYSAAPARAMKITEAGLVLGTTVPAPMCCDARGKPEIVIFGAEERILTLLAVAYGGMVKSTVLDHIRRAAQYWRGGESSLAAIELALSGLPPLRDERAFSRLLLGAQLLSDGATPRELIRACGLDLASLDLTNAGYNPDQPRAPVGSPDGGQWTSGDSASEGTGSGPSTEPQSQPSSAAGATAGGTGFGSSAPAQDQPSVAVGTALVDYKVIREPPNDAKVVIPPDGLPIRAGDPPTLLIAPPHADYRLVYAAGQAIAPLPPFDQIPHIRTALRQGGTYDFQRDPIRQETQPVYANASNYAVGVYLAGAGYSLWAARKMAQAYALFNSSNYGSKNQIDWLEQGWRDATAGRWK